MPGGSSDGTESCGYGSATATGEVNATTSREAKMIVVAAMICGLMHRFRVLIGFGCNLDVEDDGRRASLRE